MRYLPSADPWEPENQARAIVIDKRETERLQVAVQNAIVRALKFKK